MKIDKISFAVGASIGAVVAIAIVAVMMLYSGTSTLGPDVDYSNNTGFFMYGLLKEISASKMTIDQTFSNPANLLVTIRLDKGAVFVNCREGDEFRQHPEACSKTITADELDKGIHVCAHTRLYNGEFYGGKIWLDYACGPFQTAVTAREYTNDSVVVIPPDSLTAGQ